MPKKEWTPEERAAHAEKMRAVQAERKAKWAMRDVSDPHHLNEDAASIPLETVNAALTEAVADAFALSEWEPPEPEPPPPEPDRPLTEYEVFLAALPDEARELLEDDELRRMFEDEQKAALEEKRKLMRQKARDRARAHAKATSGLMEPEKLEALAVSEKMNRKVRIKPQLPFVGDSGGLAAPGVTIDGVTYHHGVEYTVPLSRALDIRHQLWCMQQNDLDFEGKGRLHGLRQSHASSVNLVRI